MCVSVYVSVGRHTYLSCVVKTLIPHDFLLRVKMLQVLEWIVVLV